MSNQAFVRREIIEEQTPPLTAFGLVGWLRENLFSNWFNAILTFISLYFIWYVLSGVVHVALAISCLAR
ncbi:MAG: hypothetical protein ACPG4F_06810, partial [Paracoccaceae bacterium]